MNRQDFQRLARTRLREARVLFSHGQYSGAYYLAGYAVECALKACIAKGYQRFEFPDKRKVNDSHTHIPGELVRIANLENDRVNRATNIAFATNWAVVKDWKESSRYEIKSRQEALDLYRSITSRSNGIFKWIRQHW